MTAYAIMVLVGFVCGALCAQIKAKPKSQNRLRYKSQTVRKGKRINEKKSFVYDFAIATDSPSQKGQMIFKGNTNLMTEEEFRSALRKDAQNSQVLL